MKKVFLTLAVVAAMALGMSKVANASSGKYTCTLYTNVQCNFTALVCGTSIEEMVEMAKIWNELMNCNMGELAD